MVKAATTCHYLRSLASNFWLGLLLSSAVMPFVPSPAIASEVQQAGASPEASTTDEVTSVADVTVNEVKIDTDIPDSLISQSGLEEVTPAGNVAQPLPIDDVNSPTDFNLESEEENIDPAMEQVTNVSQLRDVQPTDWAYEALRSLVERYGCIAGYPDGTFRGNRALSRYEFAAGVNACLQQIEKLIAVSTADFVTKEDLTTLQRLISEFGTELATLRTRVDNLEGRTQFLEENQFSTTTKLSGLAWFNVTGASARDDITVEAAGSLTPLVLRSPGRDANFRPIQQKIKDDPNITLSNLVWLTLETSFTGRDSLVTQLAAGNGDSPANVFASAGLYNTFGTPFLDQTAGLQGNNNDVIVRELFYSFPLRENIQVVVGPRINWYRYFDNNAFSFFLTGATSFNSNGSTLLNTIDRGAGAAVLWDINRQFKLRVAYLGESDEFLPSGIFNTASDPRKGVFSPTNTATAELTFSPTDRINLRLIYNYSNIDPSFPIFDQNGNITGFGIGGAPGEPIYGVADDGFGGSINNAIAHTFGLNFDWLITRGIGVFGRYSYGSTNIDPKTPGRGGGDVNAQSLQLGLAFPDLGRRGALATISYLIPFSVLDGRRFLAAGGGDGGVQYEVEAAYFFPITQNIAIVPAFYFIGNPNNFSDNPNIYVGNLRTQFSF